MVDRREWALGGRQEPAVLHVPFNLDVANDVNLYMAAWGISEDSEILKTVLEVGDPDLLHRLVTSNVDLHAFCIKGKPFTRKQGDGVLAEVKA